MRIVKIACSKCGKLVPFEEISRFIPEGEVKKVVSALIGCKECVEKQKERLEKGD